MQRSSGADQVSAGDDVITADGETIGTVAAVHESYLLVEKGVLFLTDYHVPLEAIDRYDTSAGLVYLTKTRDEALNSGWERPGDDPEMGNVPTLLTGAASTPDIGDVLAEVDEGEPPLNRSEGELN
jgi:hypothetical protein